MESAASSAQTALVQALGDTIDFVAAAAEQALGVACHGDDVVRALEQAARSPSWTLRFRVNEALERLKTRG